MGEIMDNPFRYGEVVRGSAFTDRESELAELAADIRNGQNVVIISPRRYGKTSLVQRASEQLQRDKVLIAYLDLFRTPTLDRLADHLAAAIHAGLVAPLERVWQRAVDFFQRLPVRPRITVNTDGTPAFEFTAGARERDIERTVEELLALPGRIARDRGRRVALILDEFQEVVEIDAHLPALMRAVFQEQSEVAHIFLGSKRHLMQRVFTDRNEPMYKLAKPMLLPSIPAADFSTFIRQRFEDSGRSITEEAITRILAITGSHPHDTQELCYFTWALAERVPATIDHVDRALERIVDAEAARYTALWEGLSVHQRLLLLALAENGGEEVYSQDFRRRHRLGPPSSVQRALERLIEREIVELSPPGTYRLQDVFLRSWLRRLNPGGV